MSGSFFTDFAGRDPAWLTESGPDGDVALVTRARLSRNLPDLPFPHQASELERTTLLGDLLQRVGPAAALAGGWRLELDGVSAGERRVLQEKMLLPSWVVSQPGQCGLVLGPRLDHTVLINGEDHLRLHAFGAGLAPEECLAAVSDLDAQLEQNVAAAFSPEWGYLTASPTNLGTGLRLSALLHLPGLVLVGEIERVLNALRQLQFAVRGLFGEGNAVRGGLFQVSNLITLGRDEAEIAADFRVHVGKIVTYERAARNQLYGRDHLGLEDMVQRSRAMLANARLMTAQETFDCLSNVRLGEELGLLPTSLPRNLNQLTVHQQGAHLAWAVGHELSNRDRAAARAALLREFFADK